MDENPPTPTPPVGDSAPDLAESADAVVRAGERVVGELEEALTRHLLGGRATSDVGHIIMAGLTGFLFWKTVPWWVTVSWMATFVVTAVLRAYNRRRVVASVADPGEIRAAVRRDVWIAASLWGGWALLLTGSPPKELAFLLILFAGLVAAATSTLVADGPAFFGFTGLTIGPLTIAVLASGLGRDHVALLLMIALFTPFMMTVYRRAHDVLTEQIRSTARLRISEEETARRRDLLNALVSSAPNPIMVLDASGMLTRTNPAFDRTVEVPAEAGRTPSILDVVETPEERDRLEEFLGWLRQGQRRVREISLKGREGRPIWMRLSGTAARGMAPGTLILMGEDVTEQVDARHAMERARVQAEEAARAKSSFLASMSHEIRTPMNGILGMIEILLDTSLTDEQGRTAEVIRSSGHALLRILNDILDVSKIEAGQLDLDDVDFDLHALVGEVGRVFSAMAIQKENELLVDIGPKVPRTLRGDPHRIRQILTNLVGNAVKFTDDGEIIVSVRSEGSEDGRERLRFGVKDTGIGIPADKHEEIFEEFEQADKSTTRTYGGTGLGLTISKRLVDLMGGRLRVESEPGKGSDFYFTLTLQGVAEPRVDDGRRAPSPAALRGSRFLVVDDNATARRIVRESLGQVGAAEVAEAESVDEGLRALRSAFDAGDPFAAIILDHMMPVRDGFDFVREARDDSALPVPPILMVTSAGLPGGAQSAREAGVHGYLAKPVSRSELTRALEAMLDSPSLEGAERRLVTRDSIERVAGARILLAEDNPVNQQVASALLRKRGHDVTAVADGRKALDAVHAGTFDLVLMDIQMPEMDGLEATRRIRETRDADVLPIVALTAHAFAEERARCQEAGMNDFLAKPFKPDDLFEMVERWTSGALTERVQVEKGADMDHEDAKATPPVDLDAFRQMMRDAGVEEVVEPTLDIYLTDTPSLFGELAAAVDTGEHEAVRAKAHSLKSASGNIRADRFARLLEHMEGFGKGGDLTAIRDAFPELRSEYHAVMSHLRAQRGN